jgi:hypothetical protein
MTAIPSNPFFVVGSQNRGRNSSFGQDENQDQLTSVLVRVLRDELGESA